MTIVKLNIHNRDHFIDDIVISQKDFPDITKGDIVEVYSPEDNNSRLLLQISNVNRPRQPNPCISIENSIASLFQLRNFGDVIINVVDTESVLLDSVELFFKDQYLARSDMWRLKKHMTNTCIYLNKKIEFCNIRCQVFEMWSQGCRMASGYVNEETKVVFRSASSMVYLFLQMSSEMWDYDINGDLYFEKAIKGFLSDLFRKWKTFNCSHDVTIVFFSRTFYEADDINEFPESMHECLQQDYKGRFYEDYYRVAIQNERYEDWTSTLVYLRKLFNLYEEEVIHYHEKRGLKVPRAYNSRASQGNFLEVLNMSLNVFERHNLDRSFDRTGQLSVVISPGVGIYEVDLDLTNITKQRIIDNGIGSDLVCLGEQPLHAVPLFKFNSSLSNMLNDEYNMPHWINLSFYSSKQRFFSSNFIPRIKMPNLSQNTEKAQNSKQLICDDDNSKNFKNLNNFTGNTLMSCQNIDFIDYDEYDKQIFCRTSSKKNLYQTKNKKANLNLFFLDKKNDISLEEKPERRFSTIGSASSFVSKDVVDSESANSDINKMSYSYSLSPNYNDEKKDNKFKIKSKDDIVVHKLKGQNHSTKALINPFDPSHVTIKLNSNRRRWTHVFPLGPTGIFMQQHHYQAIPQSDIESFDVFLDQIDGANDKENNDFFKQMTLNDRASSIKDLVFFQKQKKRNPEKQIKSNNSLIMAWGATGEQKWTPAITTGVDWKSLVMPACLPITTDFLPDKRTLQQDYVTYVYDLLPEDQTNEFHHQLYSKQDIGKKFSLLTSDQFYNELICQRLQQGFQIILYPKNEKRYIFSNSTGNKYTFILSIGRIYHELAHKENKISITFYHPRHPYKANNIKYCYRIRTPDNETYGVSWVDFTIEKLETYKWNYLDNYICLKGDYIEYPLIENLKYWRFRLLILPTQQPKTKKIIDKYLFGEDDFQCDIYDAFSNEEKIKLQEGFIKLLKMINRVNKLIGNKHTAQSCTKNSFLRRGSSSFINSQANSSSASSPNTRLQQSDANIVKENKICSISKSEKEFERNEEYSEQLLSIQTSAEILESMKNNESLFINCDELPNYTFISLEAIDWISKIILKTDNETIAETLFQNFLSNDLIRHASGHNTKFFKRGFQFYTIMDENNQKFFEKRRIEKKYFEKNWMEVGIVKLYNWKDECFYENKDSNTESYRTESSEFTFKNFSLEMDCKTDRVEWLNVKYHSLYDPDQAFEIILEWMVATGNAIPEIISSWGRTKNTNLHIVPIPWDPFALPFSNKSDPLRGPIYISLNIDCLASTNTKILEGERLFFFQEKILVKFGFIPFHDPSADNQRQFVHVSGSIFVMIPSKSPASNNLNKRGKFLKTNEQELACSPHEEYITRHFSGAQQKSQDVPIDAKIGFLWCWNYMITKRWKTSVTGDENSMKKIMEDFRAFCSNKNDRLIEFWKFKMD